MSEPPLPLECERVLVSAERIAERVRELAGAIERDHGGCDVHLVTVLRGGLFFLVDLMRALDLPVTIDFMAIAPYRPGGGPSVRVTKDLDEDIEGRCVILVEDVIDTGLTVNYVRSLLLGRRPAELAVCALFDKPARRIADVPIAYRGFEMGDEFLVGYGLDLDGRYRNLPFVAALKEEAVFG